MAKGGRKKKANKDLRVFSDGSSFPRARSAIMTATNKPESGRGSGEFQFRIMAAPLKFVVSRGL